MFTQWRSDKYMALMELPFYLTSDTEDSFEPLVQELGMSFSSVPARIHFNGILLNVPVSVQH